jgi:hypothetical protein
MDGVDQNIVKGSTNPTFNAGDFWGPHENGMKCSKDKTSTGNGANYPLEIRPNDLEQLQGDIARRNHPSTLQDRPMTQEDFEKIRRVFEKMGGAGPETVNGKVGDTSDKKPGLNDNKPAHDSSHTPGEPLPNVPANPGLPPELTRREATEIDRVWHRFQNRLAHSHSQADSMRILRDMWSTKLPGGVHFKNSTPGSEPSP